MNYSKIYDSLVAKAQSRPVPACYAERHHVVPKCLGGSDDAANLVSLTAREHCFAHLLLARIHGGGLWHAANMMANVHNMKSRAYAIARENHAEKMRNRIVSEATRQKLSGARRGENNPMFGKTGEKSPWFGKTLSEETRQKLSAAKLGKTLSEETRQKLSAVKFGKTLSAETRQKISDANLGKNNHSFKGAIQATNLITNEVQVFFGAAELVAEGFNPSSVYKCVNGNYKTHKGHTFTRQVVSQM
jgi:hypothetical protein